MSCKSNKSSQSSQMNLLYIRAYLQEEHFTALYARKGSGRAIVHFMSEVCMYVAH